MCSKCDQINETITRYQRLKRQINDLQITEVADRLLAKLEAQKLALHPKE